MNSPLLVVLSVLLWGWLGRVCSGQGCPIREVCLGHMGNEGAAGESVATLLEDLHNDFCGCRAIDGNIRILMSTSFPDFNNVSLTEANFTFFDEITEVSGYIFLQNIPTLSLLTFPRLRLIRGTVTFSHPSGPLALVIADSNIARLFMPRLTEITNGGVIFANSAAPLCSAASINWSDIISSSTSNYSGPTCTGQDRVKCNTNSCSSGHCWCEDTNNDECCQILSQTVCPTCNSRCVSGNSAQCCSADCVAGCVGGNEDECHACSNLNNNGTCVESCPVENIIVNGVIVNNPAFRVEAGTQCIVPPCPVGLFRLGGQCLMQCPITHQSINGECVQCDGLCPKECPGGTVTESNPSARVPFINCTVVTGNLVVGINPVIGFNEGTLNVLNTIQEIKGTLSIERWPYSTFPYLSNLRILGSNVSNLRPFPSECANGSSVRYALYIANNNNLTSIDLSSLREIKGGGFYLDGNNTQLCLIGNLSSLVTSPSAPVCVTAQGRRDPQQCVSAGVVCSNECDDEIMCWGTGADKCVSCRNFLYQPNNTCVSSCDDVSTTEEYYGDSANRQCQLCHPLCDGGCTGEGPSNCTMCTNSSLFVNRSNVIECVNRTCPVGWYDDGMRRECGPCFEECGSQGCAGPLPYVNSSAGCISCNTIIVNRQGEQIECRRQANICPDGYYEMQLEEQQGEIIAGTTLCNPCPPLCEICVGPSDSECNLCTNASSMGVCVESCGPSEMINDNATRRCEPGFPLGAAVGGAIAGVVVIVILVVLGTLLLCMCCGLGPFKSYVAHKKNGVGDNPMYGGREEFMLMTMERETLQPPKVPPNTNQLTIIAEDSLEFGKELGAGAFGTVHEGYWQPDGDTQQYHVAIKVLKLASPSADKELLQEGVVMAKMDHENVVRLYGLCMSKTLMLVSQFVPLGALIDHLKKYKDHLNAHTMLTFAYQIAKGMTYLESHHLVHRDLAARNVLVQSQKKVKITDFGLTRLVDIGESHYQATSSKMPVRWLPPESIRQRIFTHKTDVWSFAVTLWEILTFGARPYQGKNPREIVQMLNSGRRLNQPVTCTIDLYQLMLECWLLDPDSRPPFDELAVRLRDMVEDPCRYILTVKDGSAGSYTMLPSNTFMEGDTAYEAQPGEATLRSGEATLRSGVATLRTGEAIEPYQSVSTSDIVATGYEQLPDLPPGEIKALEAKRTQEYEVPVGYEANTRYVKLNIGDSPSRPAEPTKQDLTPEGPHDYDDADEKLLMGPRDDEYTEMTSPEKTTPPVGMPFVSVNDQHYEQPHQSSTIGKAQHSQFPANPYEMPNTLKRAMEDNYEFPENPDTLGSPLHNYELPDNSPDHNYELPAADYETPYTPTAVVPEGNYELPAAANYEVPYTPVPDENYEEPGAANYETPYTPTGPAADGNYEFAGDPDTLGNELASPYEIEQQASPYELPTDGRPQPLLRPSS